MSNYHYLVQSCLYFQTGWSELPWIQLESTETCMHLCLFVLDIRVLFAETFARCFHDIGEKVKPGKNYHPRLSSNWKIKQSLFAVRFQSVTASILQGTSGTSDKWEEWHYMVTYFSCAGHVVLIQCSYYLCSCAPACMIDSLLTSYRTF